MVLVTAKTSIFNVEAEGLIVLQILKLQGMAL